MKSVVKSRPAPGIEIMDMPEPGMNDDEVIIEVKACGICGSDLPVYKWIYDYPRLYPLPKIMGHEPAGIVKEIGKNVEGWNIGDKVAIEPGIHCGRCFYCRRAMIDQCENRSVIAFERQGGFTKYLSVPPRVLYKLPEGVSFSEGALFEVMALATHATEHSILNPGDVTVVIGPGPVGLCTFLAATSFNPSYTIVTGLESDIDRLKIAEKLGADEVININEVDPVERVKELTDGRGADVIFNASNSGGGVKQSIHLVRPQGQIVAIGIPHQAFEFDYARIPGRHIQVQGIRSRSVSSWNRAINLVASGKIDLKPIITHDLPLEKADEAFNMLIQGKAMKINLIP